ncbi:MAG: hypothetical protein K9H84_06850 [Bacteroidales bacterium]|nr:hypothetical protein [Bacteroidales bacterium]
MFTQKKLTITIVSIMMVLVIIPFNLSSQNQTRDTSFNEIWQKVDNISQQGKPKAAIKYVMQARKLSLETDNQPQFIKSVIYEVKLKHRYTEESFSKATNIIRNAFDLTEDNVAKALLHSFLAGTYEMYKERNYYRINNRTELLIDTTQDIKQWTTKRFAKEITRHYQLSVKNIELLSGIPLIKYNVILQDQESEYLKTVYDLLATSAIEYYAEEDINLLKAGTKNKFNDARYFKIDQSFLAVSVNTNNHDFNALAIDLFQKLFRLHKDDKDPFTRIMFDIQRLEFVKNRSQRSDASELYRFALENLLESNASHPVSTRIQYKLAEHWYLIGQKYDPLQGDDHKMDIAKALKLCNAAIKAYPGSIGAEHCKALKSRILSKEINLQMEPAVIPQKSSLALVEYKNVQNLHFTLYKLNNDAYLEWSFLRDRKKSLQKLKQMSPYKSWSLNLPDDEDMQMHRLETEIPPLGKGYYVLAVSTEKKLVNTADIVEYTDFYASNLNLFMRNVKTNFNEGYVFDRKSGKTINDAIVKCFKINYEYRDEKYKKTLVETVRSDNDGFFKLTGIEYSYSRYYLQVQKGNDFYILTDPIYLGRYDSQANEKEKTKTEIYTDRRIYRPGQTVYFKGIVLKTRNKKTSIRPGMNTKIELIDPNRETIKTSEFTTNEYGSFDGSFTLPSSGLTGRFILKSTYGSTTIRMEEYKRPRFEVSLQKAGKAFRLGDKVTMKGNAKAYAGSNISNAKVKYEVTRKPQYFMRGYSYGFIVPVPPPPPQEITIMTGITSTDESGNFEITFIAIPGDNYNTSFNVNNYQYQITAEVTDINGETRLDKRWINIGEKALLLDVDIPDKVNQQKPMKYKLSATNLDGAEIPAEGDLTIERLEQPQRLLKERPWNTPDKFLFDKKEFLSKFPHEQYKTELDKSKWETDEEVFSCNFKTAKADSLVLNCASDWEEGVYRITIKARDVFDQLVTKEKYFTLYDPEDNDMPLRTFFWTETDKTKAEPGENVNLILGSSAKNAEFHLAYGMNGKIIQRNNIKLSDEKETVSIPVKESMRGNFYINILMFKEGIVYRKQYKIVVPYSNKKLQTQLVTFKDKLKPGAKESWKLKLTGPKGEKVAAEMLASMYDVSLDQFVPHHWSFEYLRKNYSLLKAITKTGRNYQSARHLIYDTDYYSAPQDVIMERTLWQNIRGSRLELFNSNQSVETFGVSESVVVEEAKFEIPLIDKDESPAEKKEDRIFSAENAVDASSEMAAKSIRKNFNETAFFYPTLSTNEDSEILLNFTIPESVTRWKFMSLSHTKDLKYDLLTKTVQTQKDLMVMPNMPRFLRETDTIFISAKISNLTDAALKGTASVKLMNAQNNRDITTDFSIQQIEQPFSTDANGNSSVSWKLIVPEDYSAVTWRITAQTKDHSDGEEDMIPVLKNRMLVTESMPMSVRAGSTKDFEFKKLKNAASSTTLKHQSYTLEVTQNPAWYAVQSLPYLADYPHECSEQIFSRYYANSLASSIAHSRPKIKQVFDTWKNIEPDVLMSKLEKNEELKSVILSETPWLLDARDETEQKRRIAMLFDFNTMSNDKANALRKLQNKQLSNGGWPWFGGDYPNRYITQHIVAGFGHLSTLNVPDIKSNSTIQNMIKDAVYYMDKEMVKDFNRLRKRGAKLDKNHLGDLHIHYLYARSFFLDAFPIKPETMKSYQYYLGQSKRFWLKQNLFLQGMIALVNYRNNDQKTAVKIMESLKDKALYDDEMGMYWRNNHGYYWSEAPVERQALLIEAFDQILDDKNSVEEMKLWLLKQKQTQSWGSTKATSDAIYALLLRGTDLLTQSNTVKIYVGDQIIDPKTDKTVDTEAGTGYFKKVWTDVSTDMSSVKFENNGKNVAWGAVYWQYFEQLDKITGHDSPLAIKKELYKEITTDTGSKLQKIDGQAKLAPGDHVMVRIVIQSDRDMEFVHLKDMRASGLEPLNVLSKMKYQDGLRYYESTKDAATHFFFDWLPEGTYVFEYSLFVAQKGNFSNGITTIQCMYAPEFSAHSEGIRLSIDQ